MAHFLFYAGKAYQYKQEGKKHPVGEAMQEGYKQEFFDTLFSSHSAYSYEDLPSDLYGAKFAVEYFDPHSGRTLGEQLEQYFTFELEASLPENAPNWKSLPQEHSKNTPSATNKTTIPKYTAYYYHHPPGTVWELMSNEQYLRELFHEIDNTD